MDLSPSDFEYKLVAEAFYATSNSDFDPDAGGGGLFGAPGRGQ